MMTSKANDVIRWLTTLSSNASCVALFDEARYSIVLIFSVKLVEGVECRTNLFHDEKCRTCAICLLLVLHNSDGPLGDLETWKSLLILLNNNQLISGT